MTKKLTDDVEHITRSTDRLKKAAELYDERGNHHTIRFIRAELRLLIKRACQLYMRLIFRRDKSKE